MAEEELKDYSKLDNVLAEPELVLAFREKFLRNSYSSENLAFIIEIENFKDMWSQGADQNAINERANQIYTKYFSSESKYELNISGSMIEEVREKMKGNTTTTLFNKVQQSVYKMVEIDSFPRFVKSEEFQKASEDIQKRRPKTPGIFKKKDTKAELSRTIKDKARERSSTISMLEDFFKNRPSKYLIIEQYSNISGLP